MTSTAVVAAALAALTASQAPGADVGPDGRAGGGPSGSPSPGTPDSSPGDGSYHTELPPLRSPGTDDGSSSRLPGGTEAEAGVPASVLAAYKRAADRLAQESPGCGLRWELLAAIGKVESGQARGGALDKEGDTLQPILGPVLNGSGFARILDTDGGSWDGNTTYDRAVGPLQFIPSTWKRWGADGNGDGRSEPGNIHDAALAAGRYLCAGERDLGVQEDLDRAILSYNNSRHYLRTVLAWYEFYRKGTHHIPDGQGTLPTSPGAGNTERPARDTAGPEEPGGGSGEGSGRDSAERRDTPSPSTGSDGTTGDGSSDGATGDGSDVDGGGGTGGGDGDGTGGGDSTAGGDSGGGAADGGGAGGSGDGDGGDGGSSTGPDPDPGSDPDPAPEPAPAEPAALLLLGERELTAPAGGTFPEPARVRAETDAGTPVEGVKVRYAIVGDTGARFSGDATEVTLTTDAQGIATAPELNAGDTAGTFTLRASVVGEEDVTAAEFSATVGEAAPSEDADEKLTRTSTDPLTAEAGTEFAERVRIRATREGEPVADTPVLARMITDPQDGTDATDGTDGAEPEENDKGPYFEDDNGEPVRSLTGLRTDAEGRLTLPTVHADEHEGTFTLLLTTPDGGRLTVELTVGTA